jgi:phosphoglycolate phosphatase
MTLKKPDIVIWDMDGTTVRHINPRLLHILERIDDVGFKVSRFAGWLFRRGAKGPIVPDFYLNQKKPKRYAHRVLHKIRRKPVDKIVEPCPGIYLVLELLKSHNIPMAIVSNGLGKGYGHDILTTFDLEGYFSAGIFREDISKSKPHPEPLLLALNKMGREIGPTDVIWYVGDRHKDVVAALAAAKALSAQFEPIAYGLNAALAIIEKGISPDHIIISYHDLFMDLRRLLGDPVT